ncbi:MAG: four helix bundle protein [Prevotellaceae bacterium]|jgi:four helix bundle protein|nr:four helix bundle protein [Prevotellaceae bacterium]
MKSNNIVLEKSYAFAIRIVKCYQYLTDEKREFVLSKQLLRCGTSIGANVEEAVGGYSRKDFSSKLSIAYKEARETGYWVRLLRDTQIIDEKIAQSLLTDIEELLRIIGSIMKSMKD